VKIIPIIRVRDSEQTSKKRPAEAKQETAQDMAITGGGERRAEPHQISGALNDAAHPE